jgi:hypothetical protein
MCVHAKLKRNPKHIENGEEYETRREEPRKNH